MPKKPSTLILVIILIVGIPLLAYKSADLQKLLKLLPSANKQVKIVPQAATPSAALVKPLTCPSTKDFCSKGTDVSFNGNYAGFGGTLSKGSPVFAMFDGEATVSTTTLPQYNNEQIISVSLKNSAKGWQVTYIYRGNVPTKTSFKAGEQIAAVSGEVMSAYKVALLVQLATGNFAMGEIAHLTPKDF